MLNINFWYDGVPYTDSDRETFVSEQRYLRQRALDKLTSDLADFGVAQGYTVQQTSDAIDALFRTFVSEWFLYILIGADDIVTAINDDVTIGWLDTDAGGQTVRQRLINRLS